MAKGRNIVHRRISTQHARNNLPRASSPEGVVARQERRAKHTPPDTHDRKLTYTKPGSGNPKKIGR
jgi:hypothetical protein